MSDFSVKDDCLEGKMALKITCTVSRQIMPSPIKCTHRHHTPLLESDCLSKQLMELSMMHVKSKRENYAYFPAASFFC